MSEKKVHEEHYAVTICLHCGEKVSQKWVVCPICAHPVAEIRNDDEKNGGQTN